MNAAVTPLRWSLTLYISGASPRSTAAIDTVRRMCDKELAGLIELEIIDVYDQPGLAAAAKVIATPTLVKNLPAPVRRLVGDLSNVDFVRHGLDLGPLRPLPGPNDG